MAIAIVFFGAILFSGAAFVAYSRDSEAFIDQLPIALAVSGIEIIVIAGIIESITKSQEERKWGETRLYIKSRMLLNYTILEDIVSASFEVDPEKRRIFSQRQNNSRFDVTRINFLRETEIEYLTPALNSDIVSSIIWMNNFVRTADYIFNGESNERLESIYIHGMHFIGEGQFADQIKQKLDQLESEKANQEASEIIFNENKEYLKSVEKDFKFRLDILGDDDTTVKKRGKSYVMHIEVSKEILNFYVNNIFDVIEAGQENHEIIGKKQYEFKTLLDSKSKDLPPRNMKMLSRAWG